VEPKPAKSDCLKLRGGIGGTVQVAIVTHRAEPSIGPTLAKGAWYVSPVSTFRVMEELKQIKAQLRKLGA
jgi:hypothetical protein